MIFECFLEFLVIFNNAIMDNVDTTSLVRVGIGFGWFTVSSPTRMTNPNMIFTFGFSNFFFEITNFAFSTQ